MGFGDLFSSKVHESHYVRATLRKTQNIMSAVTLNPVVLSARARVAPGASAVRAAAAVRPAAAARRVHVVCASAKKGELFFPFFFSKIKIITKSKRKDIGAPAHTFTVTPSPRTEMSCCARQKRGLHVRHPT